MESKHTKMLDILKKRFDACYDDYINELSDLDAGQVIERASEIAAIKETYYEMRFWIEMSLSETMKFNGIIKEALSEQNTVALLLLDNPLNELGLKWWLHVFGNKVDFYSFFKTIGEEGRCGCERK